MDHAGNRRDAVGGRRRGHGLDWASVHTARSWSRMRSSMARCGRKATMPAGSLHPTYARGEDQIGMSWQTSLTAALIILAGGLQYGLMAYAIRDLRHRPS